MIKRVNTVDLNQRIVPFRVTRRNDGRFDLTLDGICLAITCNGTADCVDLNSNWYVYGMQKLAREGISKVQAYIREMYRTERNGSAPGLELVYVAEQKDSYSVFEMEIIEAGISCDYIYDKLGTQIKAIGSNAGAVISLWNCDKYSPPSDLRGRRVKIIIENSPCADQSKKLSSGHEQSNSGSGGSLIVPRVRLQR